MSTITTSTLGCGTPLIVESVPGVRSAGLAWLIPAGSATDPEDQMGRSAMTAEFLLRGAGDLGSREQADAFDRIGVNRSVDPGSRFIKVGLSMLADHLNDAAPLLVGMVRRPRFDEQSVHPARELALQAIESLADDPQQRAVFGARERHYPSPMNRSGYGTPEGLARVDRDGVAEAWHECARPRSCILAVAGAVEPGPVAELFERLLDGWEGEAPEIRTSTDAPRGYAHETDRSSQVQIVVVHDAPAEPHPDAMVERIVTAVLSGGMSGRLFTEVREKRGLCYAVSASYRATREFGGVTAYVGTTPERAQESLDVLVGELERITRTGVEPDEFQRAVVGLKSRLIFHGESTGARAAALASDTHKLGRPRSLDEIGAEIDAITLDRVNDYVRARPLGRMTVQTLGPAELRPPGI